MDIKLSWWIDYWIIGDECQMISFKIASIQHKQQKSILFWNLKIAVVKPTQRIKKIVYK